MPKNIVATPAAVVAVDRLTLQADDVRGDVHTATASFNACSCYCFSEE
jgi:hypothetical protein